MKHISTLFISIIFSLTILAQSPEKLSYQAVVRNSSDQLVSNQAVGIQISILQGSANGSAVYVEIQTPTSNANGLISLEIGGGAVQSGDFTSIMWDNNVYFIKTEIDPTGGSTYTITGTSQLLSVPYALHAKTANSVLNLSGNVSDLTNDAGYLTTETPELPSQTGNNGKVLATNGTNASWEAVTVSFNDLTDKPANLDLDSTDDFDGNYNNLTNKPTIPANVSDLTNDAGYLTSETPELPSQTGNNGKVLATNGTDASWEAVTVSFNDLTDKPANLDLDSTDDFDGNYNNLTNKPTIPTNVSDLTNDAGYLTSESELPTQTGNSGKYLTTNGTSVSWGTVSSGATQLSGLSDVNTSTATSGNILVADGTDFESVSISGDVTLASNGAVTIANDAVSLAKIADITRGNIIVGGAANAPTALDAKASGRILVGDGTDVASVAVSGDATLASNGALTIADNSVDGTDIALGGDTHGDIMFFNGGNWVRLGAGTAGQVLQTNGTGANPEWVTPASGGSSPVVKTVSSNTTLTSSDNIVIIVGNFTATLPASPTDGQLIRICGTTSTAGINSNGKTIYGWDATWSTMTFGDIANQSFTVTYSATYDAWFLSY